MGMRADSFSGKLGGYGRMAVAVAWLVAVLPGYGFQTGGSGSAKVPRVPKNAVGRVAAKQYVTPTGQRLTPEGAQVELPGMRPQALALSPDGWLLATAGASNRLVLIDPKAGQIVQTVPLSIIRTNGQIPDPTIAAVPVLAEVSNTGNESATAVLVTNKAALSLTGLVFSPDGRHLFLANAGGNIWAFTLENHRVTKARILPVPDANAPKQKREIPAGLAVSADGQRLYVAGNLANRLYELEAETGKRLRSWDTGVAPYDVALVGSKAYVSNLGGRRPGSQDLTAPAGKGTTVRVDPTRYIADEGSVTVIDLAAGKVTSEILVGLHASALAVAPSGKYVVVANTGSDTLSVIDTRTDRVVEKIWARQSPADLFGAQPNALAFEPSGKRLFVCNGTQNAVAVVQFEPEDNASQVVGLIPVGWFPAAVEYDASGKRLCVANLKGIGANKAIRPGESVKLRTRDFYGTVSLVALPKAKALERMTKVALRDMRYPKLAEAFLPPRPGQPPRPVPERVGEPSVFKHVIYIIKENRTYDQVLGDLKEGNGSAALCTFGERYTPNQHKLAREFVLLDNTYCSGLCSSDGHQWTDSALANEYVERQLTADSPRSYASGKTEDGLDALIWASSGFIWDQAVAQGKTFRNYGEWMLSEAGWQQPKRKDKIFWRDFWNDFQTKAGATQIRSRAGLPSLAPRSDTHTVGWDLKVPDVVRAAEFIRELRQFETNGDFPQFILMLLPNDHTGGTRAEYPTPGAQVADNDLAMGQIVEALTHSRFWPETCLLAIEDDPQAGWDHVSAYRTTCYTVSPYTKRRRTISTQYNQLSVVRTIELILGLRPMNQLDATATPMADCFTDRADLTPFLSVPNQVPLDQVNPEPKKIANRVLRKDALICARLPLDEPDRCPEDLFNRILWRAMKGPDAPYPEWAVKPTGDND